MILGLTALTFAAGITPTDLVQPAGQAQFDVSAHIRAQLQERNMMDQVQPAQSPVVGDTLFTRYADLEVSGALINRVLNRDYWTPQGASFDPAFNQRLVQSIQEPFLQKRGIKEVIGVGVSDFTGSDWRRMQNIEATIAQFDGVIIPQGATFSFNDTLGEVTEEKGFTWARVLRNSANAWGLGGGVCQVSTNVFRAALNSGLVIDERRAHSVEFDKYAPTGLDATIYLGVQDLKFTNDTPGDVLMRFVMRDEKLITVFYGTNDGRQVSLEKVHHWEGYDGRKTTHWEREVTKGPEMKADTFVSHYRPLVVPEEVAANSQ